MKRAILWILIMSTSAGISQAVAKPPIVIAHRGASGYVPEHTLASKAMAHAMGADYLEQDVVLTKDDVPVVLHDTRLETVTNVADVFPDRKRSDGHYYVIDFSIDEVKRLRVNERVREKTGEAVFPNRFPVRSSALQVPTLAEELEFIQGMNKSTGRTAGIYTELKSPAWHRQHGKDISQVVLGVLKQYGYSSSTDKVFLQCFEMDELQRVRNELKSELPLIQLIGSGAWSEAKGGLNEEKYPGGLRAIAEFAVGIGPSISDVITKDGSNATGLTRRAHEAKLLVHPYTVRADDLPRNVKSHDDLLRLLFREAGVDGVFTDFPDRAVKYVQQQNN